MRVTKCHGDDRCSTMPSFFPAGHSQAAIVKPEDEYAFREAKKAEDVLKARTIHGWVTESAINGRHDSPLNMIIPARVRIGVASMPRPARSRRIRRCLLAAFALAWQGAHLLSAQEAASSPTVILGEKPAPGPSPAETDAPATASARSASENGGVNAFILRAVTRMPSGGTYRANSAALAGLRLAVGSVNSLLVIDAPRAAPSFCSGGTYLVFLSALASLNREGRLPLDNAVIDALLVRDHQADGAGVWGRWNANGPGTARLFCEANLGHNFTSFEEAAPGDFLKIFWNSEIGAREVGHSVVYLGTVNRPEGEFVKYWSSNQPNGFGFAEVPRRRIKRALFSRLDHPEAIRRVMSLPARDPYLAAMLKRSSTEEEMSRMVNAVNEPAARQSPEAPAVSEPAVAPLPAKTQANSASPKKKPSGPLSSPAPASPAPTKVPWYKKILGG